MPIGIDLRADALRALAAGSISGTYAPIGGAGTPFTHPMRIMIAQNYTDAQLTFSFDGVNDHFVLTNGGQMIIDVSSDEFQSNGFIISIGTQMNVKGSPSTGNVYISAFFARGT